MKKNWIAREKTKAKQLIKNFYTLDTETSGLTRDKGANEPVQIAAILFKNGEKVKEYC